MTTFINFTPHTISLNNGVSFESKGIARVSNTFTEFDADGIANVVYGDLTGVPAPKDGVKYIVSAMVLNASSRTDLVAPATGHPDTKRSDKGFIISVPGFVR